MKRRNYRVLSYYENQVYNTDCYIDVVNARSIDDIHEYFKQTDMYYEILDEGKCQNIADVRLADSILFEGERVYKENENYNKVVELVSLFSL